MARRRPDPRQLSLLDLLDPARWEGRPGETPEGHAALSAYRAARRQAA
ncbi:hypothetical protein BHAOGJBA_0688 [Methylobacterium hispanicum]|uniref:Uncharacterized protein n=1 Tax=Methylobacterium hispanicum TaxID=270350 RepID=A0AAV4ZFV3_9HYPH|nr:hypothetical protein [Methylobacterium hispanicum]GJD87188.1 hypothetical protein BHAOGJBA_0688 [Methylobacterium hispanicum]